jgi:ElaB/YqjD/DUF883 family membrane-anchored ribosome-binding protein
MEAGRVASGSNDAGGNLARSVDQASMGAQVANASDPARPMVDRVASAAHQAVDRIAGAAGQAAESLGVKGEQLKSIQVRALDQCRGYVQANPLAALGIAAVAGYLLSRLLSAR